MINKTDISIGSISPFVLWASTHPVLPLSTGRTNRTYFQRIAFVNSGYCELCIGDSNYKLEKNDFLLYSPQIPYHIFTESLQDLIFTTLYFTYTGSGAIHDTRNKTDAVEIFNERLVQENLCFTDLPQFNLPVYLKHYAKASVLLDEIVHEFNIRKRFFQQKCNHLLSTLLFSVAQDVSAGSATSQKPRSIIDEVIDFIQKNYSEDITNTKIADTFNFHPDYLNRLMFSATAKTLHQYIMETRIKKAMEYLEYSDMSITQIANQVGFYNSAHFTKSFKQRVGYTPKEYRYLALV